MYQFQLTRLVFSDGTEFKPGALTVIVGANNVGKSLALWEIKETLTTITAPPSLALCEMLIGIYQRMWRNCAPPTQLLRDTRITRYLGYRRLAADCSRESSRPAVIG